MKNLLLILILSLTGCSQIVMELVKDDPVKIQPRTDLWKSLPTLDGPPIPIAVYGFTDKTGQRRPSDKTAQLSTAVTQGAEVFVIKSLHDASNWFRVVERVGLDNLVKERQLIRNQRETYEGKDAKPLKPLTVAGLMIDGAIVGYDSDIRTGGLGARAFKLGASQQYRVDEITISMRLVSITSGEILLTTAVTKTIYSLVDDKGLMMFVSAGTSALEIEQGSSINEPVTYSVRVAIEQCIYEMILEGEKKNLWRYK